MKAFLVKLNGLESYHVVFEDNSSSAQFGNIKDLELDFFERVFHPHWESKGGDMDSLLREDVYVTTLAQYKVSTKRDVLAYLKVDYPELII